MQASIEELDGRAQAATERLAELEAADAKRVRRFEAEVRKISAEATAELRATLEETTAALERRERADQAAAADAAAPGGEDADPDRLERLEAELRELAEVRAEERAQIEAILEELQGLHVDEARRRGQQQARPEPREAGSDDSLHVARLARRPVGRSTSTRRASRAARARVSVTQASRVIAARDSAGGYGSLDELDRLSDLPEQLAALKRAVRV